MLDREPQASMEMMDGKSSHQNKKSFSRCMEPQMQRTYTGLASNSSSSAQILGDKAWFICHMNRFAILQIYV